MIDRDLIGFVPNREVWLLQHRLNESTMTERHLFEIYRDDLLQQMQYLPEQRSWMVEKLPQRVAAMVEQRFKIAGWDTYSHGEGDVWYVVVQL